MHVADFIETNKDLLIERWKRCAVERLSLRLEESQLVNELPEFLDDLAEVLRMPARRWPPLEGARKHGCHRMQIGLDIGGLTEEMTLVGEVIIGLAHERGHEFSAEHVLTLMRAVAHGTSTSVRAYAALRDKDLARQAARHFSFVAHEIRTPLHNARLAAELLGAAPTQEKRTTHLQSLVRSLEQLADLVDNTLVQARMRGEPELHLQQLEARALADAACDAVALQAEARELELVREVEPFSLEGDSKLIVSALTNLLRNGVKFTRQGGRVILRGRRNEHRVLFEVADECGGMPDDLPPRLFKPFMQAGKDRTGFGLGLLIVKQAAEAHGGTVRVNNRPGKGCCFVLELPVRQQPAG